MIDPQFALDTSAAVPLLVASHEAHRAVATWAGGRPLCLSGHALAETYAVLTRLPGDARVSAADAVQLIDENFPTILLLPADHALGLHRELSRHGVVGGATYDGLMALTAREHGATLVSRDARACFTYERLGVAVLTLAS